jgi:hypothetical protein
MASENPSTVSAKRNRIIAIVAGAITITAIVVAFAGEYFDLPWKWLRPGVELLLLAELVGLVVLERHQLFEPVHDTVGGIHRRVEEIHALIAENVRTSGQVTVCTSTPDMFQTMTRVLREALARDQEAPQILRIARLAGVQARLSSLEDDPDLAAEWRGWINALSAYLVTPGSPPDGRARRWSVRNIQAYVTLDNFDRSLELLRPILEQKPLNFDYKILVRPQAEAMLSPGLITDHDVLTTFDDAAAFRWGVWFQGPQYLPLFARWFDELWASIPESYLVYSRNGFNQSAIDRIRNELEPADAAHDRRTT